MIVIQSKIELPKMSVWLEFKAKYMKKGVNVKTRIGELIMKDLKKGDKE